MSEERPEKDEQRENKDDPSPGMDGKGPGGPRQPNFMSRGAMSWLLFVVLAVALLFLMYDPNRQTRELSWQEFLAHASAQPSQFEGSLEVEDTRIVGQLREGLSGTPADAGGKRRVSVAINPQTQAYHLAQLQAVGQDYEIVNKNNVLFSLLVYLGPTILLIAVIYFLFFRSLRNAGVGPGGMLGSFGRSKHKLLNKEHSNVTLDDVAGVDEAKEEVGEIIEFLKNPKKFQRLGGRVPRGVLLIGEPGCGKTLLAKAVAGEADVPFFSISGSDFVEMFVGVGASRVRDLFKQAKDSSPCIIFLDEIDAVGRRRGSGFSSGGHDEREQTLNAILVEMDGFDSSDQVIVMAATNRSDVLDPALTRPGRFDRQINVPLPDINGRMEILRVHSRKVKMGPDVDLEKLARGTPMFSGADLAAIINEAAIGATLLNKDFVEQDDLEEARDKVRWGRSRKSHRIEEDEKKIIAYHEAGHALIMYYDEHAEPLHKVTIIPRGQALGVTFMLPEKDKHLHQRKQLLSQLRVTFGGRIAEELFCGDISSGAAMDIRQATSIARAMVTEFGMSEKLGFQLLGMDLSRNPWEQPEKSYSEDTARMIDAEVKALIDRTYSEATDLIQSHSDQLISLAEALLKYETLSYDEVDRIMNGRPLDKKTVGDLLAEEKEKHAETKVVKDQKSDRDDTAFDGPGVLPSPA